MFNNLCVRITTGALLLASSAVLLGCSSSERQASPTADSTQAPAAQPAPSAPAAPAMKAFRDPVTGEFRDPTPAEQAAMEQEQKLQSQAEPVVREEKLRKRGEAATIQSNETPLQGCAQADGSVKIDHDCAGAKQDQR